MLGSSEVKHLETCYPKKEFLPISKSILIEHYSSVRIFKKHRKNPLAKPKLSAKLMWAIRLNIESPSAMNRKEAISKRY